ncbi:MAG: SDR family oxidoreductase [Proteobacteria bacterium]|nr:SDR family oxidoreductase [Pseudomonadota bacterium]
MDGQFKDKVALVTGGGAGIGRATALEFAKERANVVVSDIIVKGGEETVRIIREAGGKSVFIKADLYQESETEALILKVIERYGRIDFAFNNTCIGQPLTLTADYGKETWDSIICTNSVWLCMKYEILQMLKQGVGAIVNKLSDAELVFVPPMSAYSTTEHGILGLTKTAALKYAMTGIRVNAIYPGSIPTKKNKACISTHPKLQINLKRFRTPEKYAAAVVWLCSDSASHITGIAMPIDMDRQHDSKWDSSKKYFMKRR